MAQALEQGVARHDQEVVAAGIKRRKVVDHAHREHRHHHRVHVHREGLPQADAQRFQGLPRDQRRQGLLAGRRLEDQGAPEEMRGERGCGMAGASMREVRDQVEGVADRTLRFLPPAVAVLEAFNQGGGPVGRHPAQVADRDRAVVRAVVGGAHAEAA